MSNIFSIFFLNTIQAGTVYVKRAVGATTGAWPGIQVFRGWKGHLLAGGSAGRQPSAPTVLDFAPESVKELIAVGFRSDLSNLRYPSLSAVRCHPVQP